MRAGFEVESTIRVSAEAAGSCSRLLHFGNLGLGFFSKRTDLRPDHPNEIPTPHAISACPRVQYKMEIVGQAAIKVYRQLIKLTKRRNGTCLAIRKQLVTFFLADDLGS